MRVLHVIESFGGGSAEAMRRYVESTPELEHHLLRALRPGEHSAEDLSSTFASVSDLPRSLPRALLAVRRAAATVTPDVVHAHSTFAGVFVRSSLRRSRARRIVYTPHCFAFERLDVSRTKRSAYRTVERALAHNTSLIAACSPREAALSAQFATSDPPVIVPNVADVTFTSTHDPDGPSIVAGMGRLGPQKDPQEFARIARSMRTTGISAPIEFIWIGDGETEIRAELEAAGVRVSGWVSSIEAVRLLASASAYLHTAAWEGFPLAVLEAVASDLPVVVRRIPAFSDSPSAWTFRSAEEGASMLQAALTSEGGAANRRDWAASTAANSTEQQRQALLLAYGVLA